jgi:hypothetical protein
MKDKNKLGQFWRDKIRPQLGNIVDIGLDVVSGDFNDAFDKVKDAIHSNVADKAESQKLISELEARRTEMEHDWRIKSMEEETKRMEMAYKAQSERVNMELESFRSEVEDKGRASNREIDRLRLTGKRDILMGTVVLLVMFMMVGVLACLVFVQIPLENQRLADMSFGTVLTMAMAVVGYYVGTTKSSRSKDETISKAMNR